MYFEFLGERGGGTSEKKTHCKNVDGEPEGRDEEQGEEVGEDAEHGDHWSRLNVVQRLSSDYHEIIRRRCNKKKKKKKSELWDQARSADQTD